ncbi:hypothetical protein SSTU70S_06963 [Stutzerimonas stutzeri]
MSITTTLQNQLNGITNGFQTIMSNVIQNATSAVASLPALIIQRADPGLYNLLTNGILQARLVQIRMDVDATRIDDPVLAQEVAEDFTHDCYGPSRAKLFMDDALRRADRRRRLDQVEATSSTRPASMTPIAPETHARPGPTTRPAMRGWHRWTAAAAIRPAGSGGPMAARDCAAGCWHRSTRTC